MGQNPLEKRVSISFEPSDLGTALETIGKLAKVEISYSRNILPDSTFVEYDRMDVPLQAVFSAIFDGTDLDVKAIGEQLVIFRKEKISSNEKYTISGYVEDAETGERLLGANIYNTQGEQGTYSNSFGFFSLTLPEGAVNIVISYIGFEDFQMPLKLDKNIFRSFQLRRDLLLGTVEINSKDFKDNSNPNVEPVSPKEIEQMPTMGGETDLMRVINMKSGVQSGAEGVGGIHVRGGSSDQNLVLLDDAPVYNPTHTWGVFSVFNSSAIQSADFYKGGFTAKHGGRLSSVTDIRTKDGNKKKFGSEIEMGLLSGKISLEGPIVKNKASFFLSGRRSFTDVYSRIYYQNRRENRGETGTIRYYFYDLNGKLNFQLDEKNRFHLSYYSGKDVYRDEAIFSTQVIDTSTLDQRFFNQDWGNQVAAFRWNRTFNKKLFGNLTLTYSRFDYASTDRRNIVLRKLGVKFLELLNLDRKNSNIEDRTAKVDFDYFHNPSQTSKFGLKFTRYRFQPGIVDISEDILDTGIDEETIEQLDAYWRLEQLQPEAFSIYGDHEMQFLERGKVGIGLNVPAFKIHEKIWQAIEPRIRLNWRWTDELSTGGSFERMTQFLHLLSPNVIGLPTDIWVSSTENIRPQTSIQYSLWLAYKNSKSFEFKVEAFHKNMNDLIEFKQTNTLEINAANWEPNAVTGVGESKGIEAQAAFRFGRLDGQVNYTISKTTRQFDELNLGQVFPYRYDRRHVGNALISTALTDNFNLSATFAYGSGLAISLPVGSYVSVPGVDLPPIDVFTVTERNSVRMPEYHRLDFGATYSWQSSQFKGTQKIKFGIYNVYFRKNPVTYQLGADRRYEQLFVPPFIPAFSYVLKI